MDRMILSQKNFDKLIDSFNHKITIIEETIQLMKNDIKWIKKLGYFMATILSAIFLTLLGIMFKVII